jgi:hydrogenase-4 membrane subunit HyfE
MDLFDPVRYVTGWNVRIRRRKADMDGSMNQWLDNINALVGGLFLLTAFGMVAMRQVKGCLNLFITQSLLLAASALVLGLRHQSGHLFAVALVNLISKPFIVPWLLRRTSPEEVYTRREIDQALNIPTALLIALALAILAYFLGAPVLNAIAPEFRGPNVPIGIAGLLLGAYTLTVRREAVPLLMGLLVMENGAFFTGIAISRDLPLLVELAIATDGLIIVFIMGVLTRAVQQHIGTTAVGELVSLRESSLEPAKKDASAQ